MNGFLCSMYPSELKNLVGFTESYLLILLVFLGPIQLFVSLAVIFHVCLSDKFLTEITLHPSFQSKSDKLTSRRSDWLHWPLIR